MAKEQKPEPVPAPAPETPGELGPPKSYRLHIALGLAGLILFQMIVLWLLLPSRQKVEQNIGIVPGEGITGYENPNVVPANIGRREPTVEKPINEGNPLKGKTARNDMSESFSAIMHVEIRKKDERNFDRQHLDRTQEIISDITDVLQEASAADWNEVGRTTIREKVKRTINNILDAPLVQRVFLRDVNFEQN
jgi:hypothetical protein